ncbi:MAG: hypothetical protein VB852_05870 [Deltaproteobacteria bacterium]
MGQRACYQRTAVAWDWSHLLPFVFLLPAGFFGGIAMACYCPLLLVANRRLLPAQYRPSPLAQTLLAAVGLFYLVFAVASVWVVGAKLLA